MKIIAMRHGDAKKDVNEKGFPQILGGSYDFDRTLTQRGMNQAKSLGRQLVGEGFDFAYTSALERAIQTGEIALDIVGDNILTEIRAELNERHFGQLSGGYCDEILFRDDVFGQMNPILVEQYLGIPNQFEASQEGFRRYLEHVIYGRGFNDIEATNIITINTELPDLGLEPVEKVKERLMRFEDMLKMKHGKYESIAVFCHGDVIKCWIDNVVSHPERYTSKSVANAAAIPSRGYYRKVPDCFLFKAELV